MKSKTRTRRRKPRISYVDKKGHPLHFVAIRETASSSPKKTNYLFCPKCDKFSKLKVEEVTIKV